MSGIAPKAYRTTRLAGFMKLREREALKLALEASEEDAIESGQIVLFLAPGVEIWKIGFVLTAPRYILAALTHAV